VGVAGRIGSGKSVIARLLERELGFQYFRYSLVLAEWFDTNPASKNALQEVGWDVMAGNRQLELNRRLIKRMDPSRDTAVDGLRHSIDYESLRQEFNNKFHLVFVKTPLRTRFDRLRHRYATYEEFLASDSHPVESNIDALESAASAVLAGTMPQEQLISELLVLIARFRQEGAA
jgi:dephospho-CoA kinase